MIIKIIEGGATYLLLANEAVGSRIPTLEVQKADIDPRPELEESLHDLYEQDGQEVSILIIIYSNYFKLNVICLNDDVNLYNILFCHTCFLQCSF